MFEVMFPNLLRIIGFPGLKSVLTDISGFHEGRTKLCEPGLVLVIRQED
jgi:hypothetical protein